MTNQGKGGYTTATSNLKGTSSEPLSNIVFRYLSDCVVSANHKLVAYLHQQLESLPVIASLWEPSIFNRSDTPLSTTFLDSGLLKLRARQIGESGLFDLDFYLAQCKEGIDTDPIEHFLTTGWVQALDPNPLFSVRYYLSRYADVRQAGIDPLTHYLERGSQEMRNPHPLFINYYYSSRSGKQVDESHSWLSQFLSDDSSNISPHPLFDLQDYKERTKRTFFCARDALQHYLTEGWAFGVDPSPLFRSEHYKRQIGSDTGSIEPYTHYSIFGIQRNVDPHPLFDVMRYRSLAKDVAFDLDPLIHYMWKGEIAGINPNGMFDLAFYKALVGSECPAQGPFWHYLTKGHLANLRPVSAFAAQEYMLNQLNVVSAKYDHSALEHLATIGLFVLDQQALDVFDSEKPQPVLSNELALNEKAKTLPWREYPGKVNVVGDRPNVMLVAHAAGEQLFGSERSFLDMLDALMHLDVNVFVVLPRNVPDYTNVIRKSCSRVFIVKYGWWRKNEDTSPEVQKVFQTILENYKIDVVHSNTIMLRECLDAARVCDIRSIVHVRELITHDVDLVNIIGLTVNSIVEAVKARADWIIGNSIATGTAFNKIGMTRHIPNTTDMLVTDMDPPSIGPRIRFGLISSNIPKKGIFDFALIAERCVTLAPSAEFLLIGPETTSTISLKGTVSDQVQPNLRFPGYSQTPKDAIAQCDVVMNLSHFAESFGRTVLEAMTCGRPVIAYDWGALGELVADQETGYLVPFKDIDAVISRVVTLCQNPSLIREMGIKAKSVAGSRYSKDAYRERFRSAYKDILPLHFQNIGASGSEPFVRPARRPDLKTRVETLRLAYFCWHFPVPSETFVLNELRVLVDSEIDVIVFCRQIPHKDFQPDFKITFERVDSPESLARRLMETSRTVVHAHFTYPTVTNMVWPACEIAKIPFTFTAHAQDIFVHKNDELNRLAEIGRSSLCLKMFTLSRFHLNYVVERGFPTNKVVINPNAIDTKRFAHHGSKSRTHVGSKRVLAIHRFVEKKGLSNLIMAGKLLEDLDLQIHIYGYGDKEAEYQKLICDLAVNNVFIHGRLSQDEVVQVLQSADLFACPSIRTDEGDMDGIPTSVIESMAAGIPVLTTSLAGIGELVEDGLSGTICEPNPTSIASAIRSFFAMPDLQVQAIIDEGQRRVRVRHDAHRTVGTMLRVWRNDVVDIVLVTWNNLAELRMVVQAIQANTALPYHLIICDNMSRKERVPQYLDFLWANSDCVTVIHNNRNAMVGPGTNLAISQGSGEYIIYVCGKEGVSFGNSWESAFIRAFDEPNIGLVGTIGYSPSYLTGEQYPTGIKLFPKFRNKEFALENPSREFGHVQGGLFAMRRQMVAEIGGFSEVVPHDYTDVEYSFYAESRGWALKDADHVLALFNKSRPTLSQRFRDDIKVAHPVLPDEVEKFQGVIDGILSHCNVCDWFGDSFAINSECPNCHCTPLDRSVFRWLSDTNLMYRRLVAVSVGLTGPMNDVWRQNFQGPNLEVTAFLNALRAEGRLPNKPKSAAVAFLNCSAVSKSDVPLVAKEMRRIVNTRGSILIAQLDENGNQWHSGNIALKTAFVQNGLKFVRHVKFSSKALGYSYFPMSLFERLP